MASPWYLARKVKFLLSRRKTSRSLALRKKCIKSSRPNLYKVTSVFSTASFSFCRLILVASIFLLRSDSSRLAIFCLRLRASISVCRTRRFSLIVSRVESSDFSFLASSSSLALSWEICRSIRFSLFWISEAAEFSCWGKRENWIKISRDSWQTASCQPLLRLDFKDDDVRFWLSKDFIDKSISISLIFLP